MHRGRIQRSIFVVSLILLISLNPNYNQFFKKCNLFTNKQMKKVLDLLFVHKVLEDAIMKIPPIFLG
tara:strand:- start:853 stop:1053 length:201 start_codon:yes stop_codon:yes gene_type:complete